MTYEQRMLLRLQTGCNMGYQCSRQGAQAWKEAGKMARTALLVNVTKLKFHQDYVNSAFLDCSSNIPLPHSLSIRDLISLNLLICLLKFLGEPGDVTKLAQCLYSMYKAQLCTLKKLHDQGSEA